MNILVFYFIIFVGVTFVSGSLRKSSNKYVLGYITWAFSLIFINLLSGIFLYYMRHKIIQEGGQDGPTGYRGRRGEEGVSDFCDFCESFNKQD